MSATGAVGAVGAVAALPVEPAGLRDLQHRVLADLEVLDLPADAELDAITRVAASMTGCSVALVNLLGEQRTCQLAAEGFPRGSVDRDTSPCHRASLMGGVVSSADLSTDPRFADLPWADGRLAVVRRYASAPLEVDGVVIGTLCVLDPDLEPALGPAQLERLADLAGVVVALLERRRRARRTEAARRELVTAHDDLRRSRAFEVALLDALPVAIAAADPRGRVVFGNEVLRRWRGSGAGGADDALSPDRLLLERTLLQGDVRDLDLHLPADAGSAPRTLSCTGSRVVDDGGRLLGAVVALADVTAQRTLEEQLRVAAERDALTGLPHRGRWLELLGEALDVARRAGTGVCVLFCDLDRFKAVNDTHGHAAGDAVLVETAHRLSSLVSAVAGPPGAVGRLGGDEFVVVVPGAAADGELLVEQVVRAVVAPVDHGGLQLRVGVSAGLVVSGPGDERDAAALLRAADAAMYAVKRSR